MPLQELMMADPSDSNMITAIKDMSSETSNAQSLATMPGTAEPHPDTDEIVRQVEFYFSDENLPGDAHLLAKTGGDGNGPVSINHILGFKKMRKYKPKGRVVASLRLSTKIMIVDDKMIQRRERLNVPLKVKPDLGEHYIKSRKLEEKPWLTKGMLKPTGFEEYANGGPIRPEEYEYERELYDPRERFDVRIESAIARYEGKRKMHALTRKIFHSFMFYGGFDTSPNQFAGGIKAKDLENHTKDDFVQMTTCITTAGQVLDGLDPDEQPDGKATWVIDFETIAKGFLSSYFMSKFAWYDEDTLKQACTVLPNFYNYLLYHEVCPEFHDQILKARSVCGQAQVELRELWAVDRRLPGQFNRACCELFGDNWAAGHSNSEWENDLSFESQDCALSRKPAFIVFAAGIMAYGTEAQMAAIEAATRDESTFRTIFSEDVGLEVLQAESMEDNSEAKEMYSNAHLRDTSLLPVGKLHCKSWRIPHAPMQDVSPEHEAFVRTKMSEPLIFLVDESLIPYCRPGIKFQARVCELDIGVKWIDYVEKVYPSFYTWTGNEFMREYKVPGPPTAWMRRQNRKRQRGSEDSPLSQDEAEDEELDAAS